MRNFFIKAVIDLQNKFNPQFIVQACEIFIRASKRRILYITPLFLYYYCCYYYPARVDNILRNIEMYLR